MQATTTKPAPVDITRARAIAAMLSSSHDGEVLNAARALVRLARAAGLRVEGLIGGGQQAAIDADYRAAFRATLHRIQMKAIGTKLLSEDERVLIFNILPGLGTVMPTIPQVESLLSIARRLGIV